MEEFLKTEMRVRGWNVARLAGACEVSTGLAAKWVSDNPRYHVRPNPMSCAKIAAALERDLDYVLELAGHRTPRPAAERADAELSARRRSIHDQLERWIAAVGPQYEEYFWRYLKAQGDSGVAFIRGVGTAVRKEADGAINAALSDAMGVTNQPRNGPDSGLRASYRPTNVLLGTGLANANGVLAA